MLMKTIYISFLRMSCKTFYAVARGRNPGVYYSWEECHKEVEGWPNAAFKKFAIEKLAWDFVKTNCPNMKLSAGSSPVKSPRNENLAGSKTKDSILKRLQTIEDQIQRFHETVMQEISSLRVECLSEFNATPKKAIMLNYEDIPEQHSELPKKRPTLKSDTIVSKKMKFDCRNELSEGSGSNTFRVDEEGNVEVYTDGACSKNGFSGAKAGIGVWFGDGHMLNISEPVKGRITNNSAEIEAATAAIEAAHSAGIKKLKLYTDSSFLISSISNWIKKWERNGWKTANGEPVKNKDELILLDKARKQLDVTFVHVKGHAGNYENEQADALARAGAAKCPLSKMY